jgi:hypothetical protein
LSFDDHDLLIREVTAMVAVTWFSSRNANAIKYLIPHSVR